MAYNGDWLNELVPTDPQGSEAKSFGDDAMREIKRALTNSFPNVETGDAYTGTLNQLSELAAGSTLPRDTVVMWGGNEATFPDGPAGWTICDGRARKDGGGGTAPDLRAKFVWGANTAGGAVVIGSEGGNNALDARKLNGDLIEFQTNNHALSLSDLPAHNHGMFRNTSVSTAATPSENNNIAVKSDTNSGENYRYYMQSTDNTTAQLVGKSGFTGQNGGHSHKFTIDGEAHPNFSNVPAYYALLYIIKD